jgi:hypothetical protein
VTLVLTLFPTHVANDLHAVLLRFGIRIPDFTTPGYRHPAAGPMRLNASYPIGLHFTSSWPFHELELGSESPTTTTFKRPKERLRRQLKMSTAVSLMSTRLGHLG